VDPQIEHGSGVLQAEPPGHLFGVHQFLTLGAEQHRSLPNLAAHPIRTTCDGYLTAS
jgi:hypothetical protein